MSEIKDKSVQVFLDELASRAPTPGRRQCGSSNRRAGRCFSQHGCNLTIGKPKYAEVEAEMQGYAGKIRSLARKTDRHD